MPSKEISKLLLKISKGAFSTLIDFVLWNIFYITEIALIGSPGKINKASILAEKDLQKFNSQALGGAINRAKEKGFIKKDFTLTKEGKQRLTSVLPQYFDKKKWDGNWYLVVYDIPKNMNRYRDILRETLKRLGFGQLQASVWISPFNFFGDIEKILKDYKLSSYVILIITDKLGKEKAKVLAERIWKLNRINNLYQELFNKARKQNKKYLYFQYLNILNQDPQLPEELLPKDWKGKEVHNLFANFAE